MLLKSCTQLQHGARLWYSHLRTAPCFWNRSVMPQLVDRSQRLNRLVPMASSASTLPDASPPSSPPHPSGFFSNNRNPWVAKPGFPVISTAGARREQQQKDPQQPTPPDGSNPAWASVVTLAALAIVICYADRSNMSTAILPMAEHFGWDKAFQGVVLSAFFGGYAATQILGGRLADSYGGKQVLSAGVSLWSLFTCLTPIAAAHGVGPLLAARVLLGVGEGVAFPAIHSIIARNVPVQRRSTAVGAVTAASYAGTALAFGLSPSIITHAGWPWVFYLFGGAAILWLPFWLPARVNTIMGDNPQAPSAAAVAAAAEEDRQPLLGPPFMGPAGGPGERGTGADKARYSSAAALPPPAMEEGSSGGLSAAAATGSDQGAKGSPTGPAAGAGAAGSNTGLGALLMRREVWAICSAQYCQSYGMYGLLTWLPTFFSDYYQVEVADLGGYTLLPYLMQGVVGAGSGALADQMIAQGWTVREVRSLLQVLGMLGPAACLMMAVCPLVGSSAGIASGLITVGLGLSALSLGAVSVSHLDIAPRHAGQVFGAGNTAATLAGLISVPFTGLLLEKTGSWPLVFGLIGVHFVVGAGLWVAWLGDKPLPEDGAEPGGGAGTGSLPA